MRRTALGLAGLVLVGLAATVTGFAATLGVESGTIDTFSAGAAATTTTSTTTTTTPAGDTTAPVLQTLEMFDVDTDGKVDQVKATFDETLGNYTAGNAPWALNGVPSGGTLSSVSVSGAVATLFLNEGGGARDTAVGAFTIALTQSSAGVRDAADNRSSFGAAAPLDRARPLPVSLSMTNGGTVGLPDKDDRQVIEFSEALEAGSICAGQTSGFALQANEDELLATLTDGNPEVLSFGSTAACSGSLRLGTITLGTASYLTGGSRTFAGTGSNRTEVVWDPTARQLRTELGTRSNPAPSTITSARTATYVPNAAMTDLAGNLILSTTVSFTGVQF